MLGGSNIDLAALVAFTVGLAGFTYVGGSSIGLARCY